MASIAPGLDGFLAQRQFANQEQSQQLGQVQGLLGIQQAQMQQGLLAQQMRDKLDQKAKIERFASQLPENERAAFLVNPTAFINEMNKKYVVGGALVPGRGGAPLYQAPVENKIAPNGQVYDPRQIQPGQSFGDPNKPFSIGPNNSIVPNTPFQQFELNKATAGKPSISTKVTMAQETEENKAVGKELGQQYGNIQSAAMAAPGKIAKLNRMSQLSDGVMTGALTPVMTDIAAVADSIGIKIDPNLGPKQAYEALSNEIALANRSTADGGGMPGALSDKDRDFLKAMGPGLNKTPEGNRLVIETGIKIERRKQEVAQMAREYRKKHKTIEGFSTELQKWSDANPLFPEALKKAESPSAPKVRKYNPATGNIE